MNTKTSAQKNTAIPEFFRPIMWSYDFPAIDAEKNKKTIIVNAINYGDLRHWKWVKETYGQNEVQKIIRNISATELRPRVLKLASLIFSVKDFNYAPRGAK